MFKSLRPLLPPAAAVLAMLGVACGTTESRKAPAPPPTPAPELPPPPIVGTATIDSVRVLKLEAFPVQGFAYVTGYLPDRATRLGTASQRREGADIFIELPTERPADAVSATELVPFEERIPLDLAGLPKGRYRVIVNGKPATFELERDNGTVPDFPLDAFPSPE